MTREEAIKVLRTESVEIGGNAVSVARWLAALDVAIKTLEDVIDKDVGKNEPITLDELLKMDGEPVWVVYDGDAGMWALVEVCEESIFLTNNLGGRSEYADDVEFEDDGITVYRQKPEEGTV